MPNGDGGGFDFSGLFDPLLGVLGAFIAELAQFLNALVGAIVNALNFLFAGELGIFGFTTAVETSVWKILKSIVRDIFTLHLGLALHHLLDLYNKLKAWAKKLKGWLDKLRKIQQAYHAKAFRDFINMIQRIRRLLVVFRILHLKFATKLDNWLAGIEGRLIQREVEYARKTNEIIGWLNVFIDPTGVFRTVGILNGVGHTVRDVFGAVDAVGLKHLFPQLAQVLGPGVAVRPWSEVSAQFREERRTNTGTYARVNAQLLQSGALLGQFFTGRSTA